MMSKKLTVLTSGVGIFSLFILFSYLVHRNLFTHFDFNMTVRLQDHISRRFDDFFSFLSDFGKFEVMFIVLLALIGLFLYWRKFLAAASAFVLFGGFHVIELYGKFFVDHLPPPQFMIRTRHIVDFPQFHVRSEFSYPSGHSARAAFLSVILLVIIIENKKLSRNAKIILSGIVVAYDLTMFVSRVYLGEHWTTDVIGGALLGAGLGLVVAVFLLGDKIRKIG